MQVAYTIIFLVLGAIIGSFLNVCIDRLPSRKSLVFPASHCDICGRHLSLIDLVPVFSFLWLRGHCRYCQAKVPLRVPLVEVGTGLLFALIYWYYGVGIQLVVVSLYSCLFLVLGIIDVEHRLILNRIVYPFLVIALLLDFILPYPGIINGIIGGITGFIFLLIPALLFRGGMGFGDVKMAALIGLVVGFPQVFVALFIGVVLGGLVAAFLLFTGKKKRKDTVPFGPFLSLAVIVALIWGESLINWYLGFL